jgi:hypothetical protein
VDYIGYIANKRSFDSKRIQKEHPREERLSG